MLPEISFEIRLAMLPEITLGIRLAMLPKITLGIRVSTNSYPQQKLSYVQIDSIYFTKTEPFFVVLSLSVDTNRRVH